MRAIILGSAQGRAGHHGGAGGNGGDFQIIQRNENKNTKNTLRKKAKHWRDHKTHSLCEGPQIQGSLPAQGLAAQWESLWTAAGSNALSAQPELSTSLPGCLDFREAPEKETLGGEIKENKKKKKKKSPNKKKHQTTTKKRNNPHSVWLEIVQTNFCRDCILL